MFGRGFDSRQLHIAYYNVCSLILCIVFYGPGFSAVLLAPMNIVGVYRRIIRCCKFVYPDAEQSEVEGLLSAFCLLFSKVEVVSAMCKIIVLKVQ
jgi:hypothetical protein